MITLGLLPVINKSDVCKIKTKILGVNVHMDTMDSFYDVIMKENSVLSVVKLAMPNTWIQGVMCSPVVFICSVKHIRLLLRLRY